MTPEPITYAVPAGPLRIAQDWPWLLEAPTVDELVATRARLAPDALWLVDEHDVRVTYGQFHERVDAVARALASQGIGDGTRVAWQLPTRISTILVMFALRRLGAVQSPIIPLYREREVSASLATTDAEIFLVPGTWRGVDFTAMAAGVAAAGGPSPRVIEIGHDAPEADAAPEVDAAPEAVAQAGTETPGTETPGTETPGTETPGTETPGTEVPGVAGRSASDPDEVRWIYFTSGSTGVPKGARHCDASLLAPGISFAGLGELNRTPGEFGAMGFPVAHVGGIQYLIAALAGGFPLLLLEAFVPNQAVELFRQHGVTTTGGAPPFYTALLSLAPTRPGELIPTLRSLKGGGAPCPPHLVMEVRDALGASLAHDYGMTEVPMIAVASPSDPPELLAETDGRLIPANQVRFVDVDGTECPPGGVGEVQVSGVGVCRGYTDPEVTKESFTADGWFRTGDLGRRLASGHVEVVGRVKDLIIRKGENIAPQEIEALLGRHPDVAEVAVIGLPDAERGERICAVLVPHPGHEAPSLAEVAQWLTDAGLMRQKLPEQIEVIDTLPRTGLAKVAKAMLRERFTVPVT